MDTERNWKWTTKYSVARGEKSREEGKEQKWEWEEEENNEEGWEK